MLLVVSTIKVLVFVVVPVAVVVVWVLSLVQSYDMAQIYLLRFCDPKGDNWPLLAPKEKNGK